jgi:hypothetical protein
MKTVIWPDDSIFGVEVVYDDSFIGPVPLTAAKHFNKDFITVREMFEFCGGYRLGNKIKEIIGES